MFSKPMNKETGEKIQEIAEEIETYTKGCTGAETNGKRWAEQLRTLATEAEDGWTEADPTEPGLYLCELPNEELRGCWWYGGKWYYDSFHTDEIDPTEILRHGPRIDCTPPQGKE